MNKSDEDKLDLLVNVLIAMNLDSSTTPKSMKEYDEAYTELEEFIKELEANAFKLGCELTKKNLCCLVCEAKKK